MKGHRGAVMGFSFHRDGTRLATAGADRTVRIWDTASGEEVLVLTGHEHGVQEVGFSPSGHRLASIGADGTLRVWDAPQPR
jgi:WD40 repeat protein